DDSELAQEIVSGALRRNQTDRAQYIAGQYSPLDEKRISTLEVLVLAEKRLLQGKIYRFQGNFNQAQVLLQLCHKESDQVLGDQRIAQLACVLYEKGDYDAAEEMLRNRLSVSQLEDVSLDRNVRLPLAEVLLTRGSYVEAGEHFTGLETRLDSDDINFATKVRRL
ncbi:MAG: hypothetical protein Q9203_007619, partial [Teloschistes exilis]